MVEVSNCGALAGSDNTFHRAANCCSSRPSSTPSSGRTNAGISWLGTTRSGPRTQREKNSGRNR